MRIIKADFSGNFRILMKFLAQNSRRNKQRTGFIRRVINDSAICADEQNFFAIRVFRRKQRENIRRRQTLFDVQRRLYPTEFFIKFQRK